MPLTDAWDWPLLYYVGTVILNMSPGVFWRSTPRRLYSIIGVHTAINGGESKEQPKAYIDQLF
jgi:uncharacterized phage protein (TIGR02216 family)